MTYFGEQNLELEEPFRIIDQFIELFNTAIADVSKAKNRNDVKTRKHARKLAEVQGRAPRRQELMCKMRRVH